MVTYAASTAAVVGLVEDLAAEGWKPKNRAIPKWMVKIMENPIKMDDLDRGIPKSSICS